MKNRRRASSPAFYWGTRRVSEESSPVDELRGRLSFAEHCLETLRADNRTAEERMSLLNRRLDESASSLAQARLERDFARRMRDEAETALRRAAADLEETSSKLSSLEARHTELARKYADLVRENSSLKHRLKIRDGQESPFGDAGSPSCGRPFKANSPKESQDRKGGARKGHAGHGRRSFAGRGDADALHEVCLDLSSHAPCCGDMRLKQIGVRRREYDRYIPARTEHVTAMLGVFKCKACGKVIYARPDDVLRRMSYSNTFLAAAAVKFYMQGHAAGDVQRELGMKEGAFFSLMDTVADKLEPAFEEIRLETARQLNVHVDETSWWIDGVKGYAWTFCNRNVQLLLFPGTRSSSVPAEIFGYAAGKAPAGAIPAPASAPEPASSQGPEETEAGSAPHRNAPLDECRKYAEKTIVSSDRFSGYSPLDVRHQYCFEHLKRDLKKLLDYSAGNDEVKRFHDALLPLLAESMRLCSNAGMSDEAYYEKAREIREKIRTCIFAEAKDNGVRGYQDIWRSKWDSLFAWVDDRRIKCENNAAERSIRPTVIARKISMGSQGKNGARNREIITSVLATVKNRGGDPYRWLVEVLDSLARAPDTDVAAALPEVDQTLRKKRRISGEDSRPA